jgi:hypothetical protein
MSNRTWDCQKKSAKKEKVLETSLNKERHTRGR